MTGLVPGCGWLTLTEYSMMSDVVGKLDRRIIIQEGLESQSSSGAISRAWTTYNTVWAKLEDMGGGESYQAGQEKPIKKTVFTVRYDSGLNEKMRVFYGSRYYDIRLIEEEGRQDYLKLTTIGKSLYTGGTSTTEGQMRTGKESITGRTPTVVTFSEAFRATGYSLVVDSYDSAGNKVVPKITSQVKASFTIETAADCTCHYHAYL